MAFQLIQDPAVTSSFHELLKRTAQNEQLILRLQDEIEFLEAGDYKTYVMHKIVEIRQSIQLLDNTKKQLLESNQCLKLQIDSLQQSLSQLQAMADSQQQNKQQASEQQEEEEKQPPAQQPDNNDDANNNNDNNENENEEPAADASHGYANKKLAGKCQCEMCREGIATTHNDDSHDQSLFGKFTLDVDANFKLELVGGSTKCGRVMANYFAYLELTKKANVFKERNCLEVGSGTGIVGCTVAYLGASKVMMTDQPGVIEILAENAKQLNQYDKLFDRKIEIGELLWGEADAQKYVAHNEGNGYDVLIGSDLIYAHEFIAPLVTTFEVLSNRRSAKSKKHAIVFMSVIRRFKWEENFFNLMKNKFVQSKELEVGDICIYKYVRKEDVNEDELQNDKPNDDK